MCSLAILLAWIHLYAFCMGPFCSVWCMALHIWFFIRHFLLELHLYVIEYIIKNFQTNSLTYHMLFNIDYCLWKYCLLHFSRSVPSLRETTEPCNYFILFFMLLFYLFFTFNPLYLVHNITKCNTWYALSSWKLTIQIIKYYYYSISQK